MNLNFFNKLKVKICICVCWMGGGVSIKCFPDFRHFETGDCCATCTEKKRNTFFLLYIKKTHLIPYSF